jgi:hypothetical protein
MAAVALGLALQTGETHLLIVCGIPGEAKYAESFRAAGSALADAAAKRFGVSEENITYLADDPSRDPGHVDGRSTRAGVVQALKALAARAGADDQILIVLIGHGSYQGAESRFNLPGPDLSATELAGLLAPFRTQRLAVINASSASGEFIAALSARNRVIVTATKTGFERNETIFPRFFAAAFASDGADVDKDGRISLLEAFDYARREVARAYETDGRLLTEHALLDDNGDKTGSAAPNPGAGDGALARTFFLSASVRRHTEVAANSRLSALHGDKEALEAKIARLRTEKAGMDSVAYDAALETLLVELAEKTRLIREIEAKP